MSNDSVKRIMIVTLGVCTVCSILVSTAAVSLHAIQEENKRLAVVKNSLIAGGLLREGEDIRVIYRKNVRPLLIELSTGTIVPESRYNDILKIEQFDIKEAANHPEYGRKIPPDKDIAGIKTMPKYMPVYLLHEGEKKGGVIFRIYGKGLWSTMYGFLALESDMKTVKGMTFYEHGETPGLGGEIENPRWLRSWKGKEVFDDAGNVRFHVIKGQVDRTRPEAKYQVDGISGATLTARGVDNLVQFWMGDDGYGPFLKRHGKELR